MEVVRTPPAVSFSDNASGRNISGTTNPRSSTRKGAVSAKVSGASTKGDADVGSTTTMAKPKLSKSRNGCVTCKSKRLKCDEAKPVCRQCQKRNVTCGGYKKDFKWRQFEESSFTNKLWSKGKNVPTSPCEPRSTSNAVFLPISNQRNSQSPTWRAESKGAQSESPPSQATPKSGLEITLPGTNDAIPSLLGSHELLLEGQDGVMLSSLSDLFVAQSPDSKDDRFPETHTVLTPETSVDGQHFEAFFSPHVSGDDGDVGEITSRMSPGGEDVSWNDRVSLSRICRALSEPTIPMEPKFSSGSFEMLLMRFDRKTCGVLSVKDGLSENPWRTLVWPLAKDSPALCHAICSLAAFHYSKKDPQLKLFGMDHMRRSIRALAMNIRTMRTDAALATTLALTFAESWDRHTSNGIQHLRGAQVLLNQALENQRSLSVRRSDVARLRFLHNAWVYAVVMARLTSLEESGFDGVLLPPEPSPSACVHEIDPLLGCAATLFPLISRVANLVQKVCISKANSISIISQAIELKTSIEQWEPPIYFEPPEDPTSDVQHSYQSAQAYRWATLLHLHRAVPEIPSESAGELAKRVLVLLATIPLSSRTIVVHIFPLLTASCEVDSEEDRVWVRERWSEMQARLQLGNIDRCVEVVHAVWSRRDDYILAKLRDQQVQYVVPVDPTRREEIQEGRANESVDLGHSKPSNQPISGLSNLGLGSPTSSPPIPVPVRRGSMSAIENLEYEKTVRGRLHWLSIMRDWKWEAESTAVGFLAIRTNIARTVAGAFAAL
ncbi:hypothetical protein PRK78_006893 [Emydomyces testavorans]|uniref:Zn(2)-C6 fungal-type domain-containing protein n=1 Tax=Emydomyces testavorans TaxID=2070801 RepID=A0AAF0DND3_9EURO|nr:hypothetical protein PRK78_006893 [Emydomyces testavorans]